jgi:hypothetical protein
MSLASGSEKPKALKTRVGTSRWTGGWAKKKSRYGTAPCPKRCAM